MKPRIGHIVFHPTLYKTTESIAMDLKNKIKSIEIVHPNPYNETEILQTALDLQKRCDVIISREDTINLLAPSLTIPVIGRTLSYSDIIEALYLASLKSKKVGLVLHSPQRIDLSYWPKVLGIEVFESLYNTRQDALNAVLTAKKMGAEVIAGGVIVEKYVLANGLSHQMIEQSKGTVIELMNKAIDVFNAIQKEKEHSTHFKALLDFAHEGVILLGQDLTVSYLNNRASQLLKIAANSLLHKHLIHGLANILLPEGKDALQKALSNENFDPHLGVLVKSKSASFVFNIVSPDVGDKMTTIMTFTEASLLQKMEYNVRQQLSDKGLVAKFTLDTILGISDQISEAKKEARAFAATDSNILVYGETGTGKELFAQSIHNLSNRKRGPFVAINCSALPKELMESELFGYEEGAFTGARKSGKIGLFELAHGGTIFLDELSTMPLDLQSKILRVIQEKEVTRLGGDKVIPINVRIISASNRDLWEAVQSEQFRQDLFFRLNVLQLKLPSLRDRREDIPILFKYFVAKFSSQLNPHIIFPSEEESAVLLNYNWPGNVRELENFAERYVATSIYNNNAAGIIEKLLSGNTHSMNKGPTLNKFIENNELELIISTGNKYNWNKRKMAQDLGISETTLWRKLKKAGISTIKLSPLQE